MTPGSEIRISVVLPAHNEEGNIEFVLQECVDYLPTAVAWWEVIVVNDGSQDQTGQLVDRWSAEHEPIRVVHHERNRGYGAALVSGFQAARGDWIFFMDSDRQFQIKDLGLLLALADEADIVAGIREHRRDGLWRSCTGGTYTFLARTCFGVPIQDVNCAFKLFRADVLEGVELLTQGALINAELLALTSPGRRVAEVVVPHYARPVGEQSGTSPRVVLRAAREGWELHRRLQRRRRG